MRLIIGAAHFTRFAVTEVPVEPPVLGHINVDDFTGVASGARTIAKVLFFIALIAFVIVLVFGVFLGTLVF